MKIFRTIGFVLACCFVTVQAGINRWTGIAPYGRGTVNCIAIAPSNPSAVYLGSRYGVFRSLDSLNRFRALGTVSDLEVNCLAVHPDHPAVVFAGDRHCLQRSDDGGDSWTQVYPQEGPAFHWFDFVSVSPTDPAVLYAGFHFYNYITDQPIEYPQGTILKSVDGGSSWQSLLVVDGDACQSLAVSPANPSLLFAAYTEGIYRSSDGGTSWTKVFDQYIYTVVPAPIDAAVAYAATANGVYKSSDGGNHWQIMNAGLTRLSILALAIDPAVPETLYAGTWGDGLFKTLNGGILWTPIAPELAQEDILALAVDSASPRRIYAGTQNQGLWESPDGGASWHRLETTIPAPGAVGTLTFAPADGGTALFAGVAGSGGYLSFDQGLTWTPLEIAQGVDTITSWAVSPEIPIAVYTGTNLGVYKTTDTGATWVPCDTGRQGTAAELAADPVHPGTLYAGGDAGLFKTVNGGGTWQASGTGLNAGSVSALAIDPFNPAFLLAGVVNFSPQDFELYRSTDSGANWHAVSKNHIPYAIVYDPLQPSKAHALMREYAYGPGSVSWGSVYLSTDGGETWALANQPPIQCEWLQALVPSPVTPGELFLMGWGSYSFHNDSCEGGDFFRGTGDGPVWESVAANDSNPGGVSLALDPTDPDRFFKGGGIHGSGAVPPLKTLLRVANGTPFMEVCGRRFQFGGVNRHLETQVLPTKPLHFRIDPASFPSASAENPVLIGVRLPEGVTLTETVANGEFTDITLEPAGKWVFPLAVCEYREGSDGTDLVPVDSWSLTAAVPESAVQLFRWVAGENTIWLRLTQGTSAWVPRYTDRLLGFTLGVPAGSWPSTPASNWGGTGRYHQVDTTIRADVRGFDITDPQAVFTAAVQALDQRSGLPLPDLRIEPSRVILFQLDGTPDQPLLGTPGSLSIEKVDGGMNLVWLDRSGNEDGFHIWRWMAAQGWVMIGNTGTGVTWFRDWGFDSNAITIYQVRAFNLDGESEPSNACCFAPFTVPPLAPALLSAEALSSHGVELRWAGGSGNETGYNLWRQQDGGAWTFVVQTDAQTTSYRDFSASAGSTFCYGLRAFNNAGISEGSNLVCAVPSPIPPPAPEWLTAESPTSTRTQVNLRWDSGIANEDGFYLWRQRAGGNWERIAVLGRDTDACTDQNVSEDTWYCYGIRAFNADGISAGSPMAWVHTAWSLPPASALSASIPEPGKVLLTWDSPGSSTEGFVLWRQVSDGVWTVLAVLPAAARSYTDTSVNQCTWYSYGLRAYNAHGVSGPSNIVKIYSLAVAVPQAPSELSVTMPADCPKAVDLEWLTSATNNEGFDIWRQSAGEDWERIARVTDGSARRYRDLTVSESIWYCYGVRAFNSVGISEGSPRKWVYIPGRPLKPVDFTCLINSDEQMTLSWTPGGSGTESGFRLYRRPSDFYDWSLIATLAPDVRTYRCPKPEAGTKPGYRIEAFNAGGVSDWQVVSQVYLPQLAEPWYSGRFQRFGCMATGLALADDGNLLETEPYSGRVLKLNAEGVPIASVGTPGTGDGQFDSPSGVAVDPDGNIYISDWGNDRIQKFDRDGNFLSKWGSDGTGEGQFRSPAYLGLDRNGFLYVGEFSSAYIQKFSLDGTFILRFGGNGTGDGQINGAPSGLAVDSTGNVYVCDGGSSRIQKFSAEGIFLAKWSIYVPGDSEWACQPKGIAIDGVDRVLITDEENRCVKEYDTSGHFIRKWGGLSCFPAPRAIAVSPDGKDVWLAEYESLQRFRQNALFNVPF